MADKDFNFLIKETAKELGIEEEIVRKEIDNYLGLFKKELKDLNYYGYDFFFIGKLIPMISVVTEITRKMKKSRPELYTKFYNYLLYARKVRKEIIWKKKQ